MIKCVEAALQFLPMLKAEKWGEQLQDLMAVVDLGATKILSGIATSHGQILVREKFPTLKEKGPEDIIERICHSIKALARLCGDYETQIAGAVVAAPGPLAYPEGVVLDSPNLAWTRVPLKDELGKRLAKPVIVDKDTNLAALGEYYFGRQDQPRSLLYITVSTGIGGGIILDGQIWRGQSGGAGEIGHMVVDPRGKVCKCGRRGCLEAMASGAAIGSSVNELRQEGKGTGILAMVNAKNGVGAFEVAAAARQGDAEARTIVNRVVEYLGQGIANLVNIFNPELVVLGGGVALGWQDLILEDLNHYVKKEAFALNIQDLKIKITRLGEDIVLYGCIAAALQKW